MITKSAARDQEMGNNEKAMQYRGGDLRSLGEGPILRVSNLKRYFDVSPSFLVRLLERQSRQTLRAVDGVSFTIGKGETFSLVGESGCGKSTVAKLVVGLYPPTDGIIEYWGMRIGRMTRKEMAPLRSRLQMIFQDPYASLNPRWRAREIIAEPVKAFGLATGKTVVGDRVGELLSHVGLTPADGEKYPHEFSGGQRQRISIARALASRPEFLVCDEPTSALDVSVQAQILNLMRDLQREFKLTYLFISHDLAVVYHISDRVGIMYLGRLVEVAPARVLFRNPRHPYTRMLLDAIPDLEMTGRQRMPIGGEVPNPIHPPPGCGFHPRCPFVTDRCRSEVPLLVSVAEGAFVACHRMEGEQAMKAEPGKKQNWSSPDKV
jgi:peptide/nickel transport system ATP-binding protein